MLLSVFRSLRVVLVLMGVLWVSACLPILHESLAQPGDPSADPALVGIWQLDSGVEGRVHAYVAKLDQQGLEVALVGIGTGEDGLNVQYYRAYTTKLGGKNFISLQARLTAGHDMIERGHEIFGSGWLFLRYEVQADGKTLRYWAPKERAFGFARDSGDLVGEKRSIYWIFTSPKDTLRAFVSELRDEDFHPPQDLLRLD